MHIVFVFVFSFHSLFFEVKEPVPEIKQMHHQIRAYYKTNMDSAVLVATQAIEDAHELGDSFGEAKSLALLANTYDMLGNTNGSVSNFLEALKQFDTIGGKESLSIQSNICLSLGSIYEVHHRINEAIEFYDKGLQYAMETTDQRIFVLLIHNKALAYRKLGEPQKAKELLEQKLKLILEGDQTELLYVYNQLGLVYRDLKDYNTASYYYERIINLENDKEHSQHRGRAYHNKASIFTRQKNYSKSWEYYNKALIEKIELGNAKDLFNTYQDMAELALIQGKTEQALFYAQKATPLLNHVPRTPEYYDQYQLLSRCVRNADPVKGFEYSDRQESENAIFIALQKELIAMGEGYKMDLITTNYFNEIIQQQQRVRTYWTVGCGLFFLLTAVYFSRKVWRIYRYKSPQSSLALIKNQHEMLYLLDTFRNEKEEYKKTIRQKRKK